MSSRLESRLPETAPLAADSGRLTLRRRLTIIAGCAGLLAFTIDLIGSWIPSLWGDEAASLLSAERPLPTLFAMLGHVDAVHGLYYLLLHFWVNVAGTSPFAIRLPSAVAVGIAVAAITWMCGRLHSIRLAVLAGVVGAVLPRLTYAGEEARAYAFDAAICAVLFAIVAEIVLARDRRPRLWIAYGVLLALGTYMFLYDLLTAVAVGVFLLLSRASRRTLGRWAIATGSAALVTSPLLFFALAERAQVAYLAHRTEVTAQSILQNMWFGSAPFAIVAWTCILIACVALVVRQVRPTTGERRPDVVLLALCWLVVPVGVLIASIPFVAGFTARYATFAAPAAAVLIAAGIEAMISRTRLAVLLTGVVVLAAVPVWAAQRGPYAMNESDWNQIASFVQTNARSGDGIVFDEAVRPSRRTRLAMDTDPAAFSAVKDLTLDHAYPQNTTWHDTAYSVEEAASLGRFDGVDRVWVVEYSTGSHTDSWGISSLDALGYHVASRHTEHRSVIYLFTK